MTQHFLRYSSYTIINTSEINPPIVLHDTLNDIVYFKRFGPHPIQNKYKCNLVIYTDHLLI